MKNREKHRDELRELLREPLVKGAANTTICGFIRDNVWPSFLTNEEIEQSVCGSNLYCDDCTRAFSFWLDEEYEEPPKPEVDWSRIPVDTLVQVRDRDDEEWTLKYFKNIDDELPAHRYVTWEDGATSKTAYGYTEHWTFCELVEDEEDEE